MSNIRDEFKNGEIVNSVGNLSDQAQQHPVPGHASTTEEYQEKPLPPLPSARGRSDVNMTGSPIHSQHVVDNPIRAGATSIPIAASTATGSWKSNLDDSKYDRHIKHEHDEQNTSKSHVPRDGSPTRETFETRVGQDKEPYYKLNSSIMPATSVSSGYTNYSSTDNNNDNHKQDQNTSERSHVPRDGSPTRESFESMVHQDRQPTHHANVGTVPGQRGSEYDRRANTTKSDSQNYVARDGNPDREHFEYIAQKDRQPQLGSHSYDTNLKSTTGEHINSSTISDSQYKPSATHNTGSDGSAFLDKNNINSDSHPRESLITGAVGVGSATGHNSRDDRLGATPEDSTINDNISTTAIASGVQGRSPSNYQNEASRYTSNDRDNQTQNQYYRGPIISGTAGTTARPQSADTSREADQFNQCFGPNSSNTSSQPGDHLDNPHQDRHITENTTSLPQMPQDTTGNSSKTSERTNNNDQQSNIPLVAGAGVVAAAVGVGAAALSHKLGRNDDQTSDDRHNSVFSKQSSENNRNDGVHNQSLGNQDYNSGFTSNNPNQHDDSDSRSHIHTKYSTSNYRQSDYSHDSDQNEESTRQSNSIRQKFDELTGRNEDSQHGDNHAHDHHPTNSPIVVGRSGDSNGKDSGNRVNELAQGDESNKHSHDYSSNQYSTNSPIAGDYGNSSNRNAEGRFNEPTHKNDNSQYSSNYSYNQHHSNIPIAAGTGATITGTGIASLNHRSDHNATTDYPQKLPSSLGGYDNITTASTLDNSSSSTQGNHESFKLDQSNRNTSHQTANSRLDSNEFKTRFDHSDLNDHQRNQRTSVTNDRQVPRTRDDDSGISARQASRPNESNLIQSSRSDDSNHSKNFNVIQQENRGNDRNTSHKQESSEQQSKVAGIAGAGIATASALAAGAAIAAHETKKNSHGDGNNEYDQGKSHNLLGSDSNRADSKINPTNDQTPVKPDYSKKSSNMMAYDSTQPHIGGTPYPTMGEGSVGNVAKNDPSGNLQSDYPRDQHSSQYKNKENETTPASSNIADSSINNLIIGPSDSTTNSDSFRKQSLEQHHGNSAAIIGSSAIGSGIAGSALSSRSDDKPHLTDQTRNEESKHSGEVYHSNATDVNTSAKTPYDVDLYPSGNILNPSSYNQHKNISSFSDSRSNKTAPIENSNTESTASTAEGAVLGTGVAGLMDQHRNHAQIQPVESKLQNMSSYDPTFVQHSGQDITDIPKYDNINQPKDLNEDGYSYEQRVRESVGYNRPNESSNFPGVIDNQTHNVHSTSYPSFISAETERNTAHHQRMPGDFPEEHAPISRDNQPSSFGGIFEKVKGTVKESVGHMIGNERMAMEGEMEKHSGQVVLDSARASKANQR